MIFNASNKNFENAEILGSDSEIEYDNLYKAADTLQRKEREKLLMNFVKTHSDNILGSYSSFRMVHFVEKRKNRTSIQSAL